LNFRGSKFRKMFGKKRAGSIMAGIDPIWKIVGIAIGLAVLSVVAGLSVLFSGTSAGIISAGTQIVNFLSLIGLGIAVSLLIGAFSYVDRRSKRG
jgi:uncharacterized YccA/Bax inhibitor family protein